MPDILDDIHECAAEVFDAATEKLELYADHPDRRKRHQSDLDMAQRVMDQVEQWRQQS